MCCCFKILLADGTTIRGEENPRESPLQFVMRIDVIVTKLPYEEFNLFGGVTSPDNLVERIFSNGDVDSAPDSDLEEKLPSFTSSASSPTHHSHSSGETVCKSSTRAAHSLIYDSLRFLLGRWSKIHCKGSKIQKQ